MTVANNCIGIGTVSPAFPLDVQNTAAYGSSLSYRYLSYSSGVGGPYLSPGPSYSIRTSGPILCSELDVNSDARIKDVMGYANSEENLNIISQLKVTKFRYIDKIAHGNLVRQGFIAQDVQKVLPEAVKITTNFIPNVYEVPASFSFRQDKHELSITMNKVCGLKVGDKVKLMTPGGSQVKAVIALSSGNTFTIADWNDKQDSIFVYGKEVNDFRSVDYERIFTIGIGAIQELSRRNNEVTDKLTILKSENEQLKAEVEKVSIKNSELQKQLDEMKGLKADVEQIKAFLQPQARK